MTDGPGTAPYSETLRRETIHGTFSVVRELAAAPDRVYSAYADFSLRQRWFRLPGDPARGFHELDFRVGGSEAAAGVFAPAGEAEERLEYRSAFWELEPGARIVFGYAVTVNGVRRWTSLVTVELSPLDDGAWTLLRHTEQYAYLAYAGDGAQDVAHLKGSVPLQLNGLAVALGATSWPHPEN